MKAIKIQLFLLSFCLPWINTYPQETVLMTDTLPVTSQPVTSDPKDGLDLFASEALLEMNLSFNFRELLKTRNNPENLNATLTIKMDDSSTVTQEIKIKARGVTRRTISYFPPIMLKFKNGKHETGRIREGSVKLVTPCNQTELYENYVLKEYLAYKMFNLITPYSFKTRLVRIIYTDANKPKNSYTYYGFLLENDKEMARRNNAFLVDSITPVQAEMNSTDMARVAVFNYMIGNTDWSLPNMHNVKILSSQKELTGKGIPVAYDFDYSGFVNAEYSVPTLTLPIKDVTERYYMGMCYNKEELSVVIGEFAELKNRFINTIENFNLLSPGEKKRAVTYINSFYKETRSNYALISDLNRTCKPVQ
jgi:hypothetical protein